MGGESRVHPRYAVEVDAEVRYDHFVVPARTKNVSRGGICILADREIGFGIEVEVQMALVFDEETFSEPLTLRARVVWCTQMGGQWQVGTSFVGMTGATRSYLELFLRYLQAGLDQQQNDNE